MSDAPQTLDQFLDAQEATPAETPAEAPPPTPTAEAAAQPEELDVPAETSDSDDDGPFSLKDARKLREENKRHRLKAKELEERYGVFDSYGEEDRQVWVQLARTMAEDPKAAATWMRQIAEAVAADYPEAATQPEDEGEAGYLTKADYERLREEELQATRVAKVEADAKAMGYDPESRDYVNLLLVAQHDTKGDLKAAHEILRAERQKIVDEYLTSKQTDAQSAPVAPAGPVGTPASGERPIKDFKDARAALEEYLAAQPGT